MIIGKQHYISDMLTHFVGRAEAGNIGRYKIFSKILQTGILTSNPRFENNTNVTTLTQYPHKKISSNEAYNSEVVCFCDIPIDDMKIHVKKYGPFGISFSKDYIAQNGGSPVFYIAGESKEGCLSPDSTKKQYYDQIYELCNCISEIRDGIFSQEEPQKLGDGITLEHSTDAKVKNLLEISNFLNFHIFSRLKFFDHRLDDEDPDNYYFEREWRIFGHLKFELDDVKCILIPNSYSKIFRNDFSNYFRELIFSD